MPDLNPNVGVFWYFFTEVFEHYHQFFLCVFQINILVYVLPLAITLRFISTCRNPARVGDLRHSPVFLFMEYHMLVGIFKPYPSVADAAIFLSFLPAWAHLFHCEPGAGAGAGAREE